jgi:chaperonin cofactor prefoldin
MIQQRQLLDGQLNENQNVLEELNKLAEDKNTVRKISVFFFGKKKIKLFIQLKIISGL